MGRTLKTQNEDWGFWGTFRRGSNADIQAAWEMAMTRVQAASGFTPEEVRLFLDSRYGRHFADSVVEEMSFNFTLQYAFDRAVETWQRWKVSSKTMREYDIPVGASYLAAMVAITSLDGAEPFAA